MKIRKSLAGIAAAALAATGLAVATAPTANAFSGSVAGGCWIDGISTSIAAWNTTHTVTLNGSTSAVTINDATALNVNYSFAQGPNNGGPDLDTTTTTVKSLIGIYNGAGTLVASATANGSVGNGVLNGTNFPGETFPTVTFAAGTLPAGTYTAKVALVNWSAAFGAGLNVVCTGNATSVPAAVAGNPAATAPNWWTVNTPVNVKQRTANFAADPLSPFASTALTVTGPQIAVSAISSQAVTNYARANNVITLGAGSTGWPASASITAVTVGGAAATNTLSVDGTGLLAGTITVPAAATTGLGSVSVTAGGKTATYAITILGAPTLTLTPASGGPGQVINVTGSNYSPTVAATLYLCDGTSVFCAPFVAAPNTALATGTASVNGSGSFTGTITVPVTALQSLRVQGAQGSGPTAVTQSAFFTVNSDTCTSTDADGNTATPGACSTKQNISATVNPGALTQQANDGDGAGPNTSTFIQLGSAVTTSVTAQTETGNINPITVTDTRGGTAVWTLTAALTTGLSANSGANTIANTNLALGTVGCAAATGSATGITAGTGGNFGSTLTVCDASTNNSDSAGGTKGGQWVATAPVTLTVPAFQAAGTYNGTITFTLT